MKKLRSQSGMTLTEMLCAVIVVLLFSSLVAVGANAAVRSFRTSMADSQAQELCSTLVTAISDKLRYCGTVDVSNGKIFIQDVGSVTGSDGSVFQVDLDSGQLYLGDKKFLGAASYPEGLQVSGFSMSYRDNVFDISFQIVDRQQTKLASADFQVRRINQ